MTNQISTSKQLEKDLSRKIKALYSEEINITPQKVSCKLFSKYLAIIADRTLTPVEKSLWSLGKKDLIKQVRSEIGHIFQSKLIQVIEDTVGVKIVDVLSNVTFDGNQTGILIILSEPPKLYNIKSQHKVKIN